ncbi:SDR family oxidoreductase [Pseudomonas entomophila]|uniref:SDR family oxidoreductase n=1 Tax=Pseudomonas entomophila TaxID=312306 RepID=UPI0015E486D0|nr:SDR family oxidoreductase [Pseudomonas entomophila]MBA1194849.1 SDR family oxidoreductase [Pseudomonas entomophila]
MTHWKGGETSHNGRVALVTGAARGIGLGIAAWLICEGWQVVLSDVDRKRGAKVAKALGDNAWFVSMDVADEKDVVTGVAQVLGQFGRLDALVCNAAVADPHSGTLESLSLSQWNRVLAVNLSGAMLLAKHCAPYLRAHGGAIVNLASTRAHQSEPDTEAYAASKGGLMALTHALAISLGPEIRVNAVSPGWIDARDPGRRRAEPLSSTDHGQHPVGRVGTVEDVAALVAWLLSGQASFVTGQEYVIDGGMTRKMIYV